MMKASAGGGGKGMRLVHSAEEAEGISGGTLDYASVGGVFATGIRNTEKIRHRPGTTEIWGWDHGSDNFGRRHGEKTGQNQPITDLLPPKLCIPNHPAAAAQVDREVQQVPQLVVAARSDLPKRVVEQDRPGLLFVPD